MPPTSIQREFCRRLFRAGGDTAALRHEFLDELADAALKTRQSGRTVVSTSVGGASTQFQLFDGFTPDTILDLVDQARGWADAADVNAALGLITPPIRSIGADFSQLRL